MLLSKAEQVPATLARAHTDPPPQLVRVLTGMETPLHIVSILSLKFPLLNQERDAAEASRKLVEDEVRSLYAQEGGVMSPSVKVRLLCLWLCMSLCDRV